MRSRLGIWIAASLAVALLAGLALGGLWVGRWMQSTPTVAAYDSDDVESENGFGTGEVGVAACPLGGGERAPLGSEMSAGQRVREAYAAAERYVARLGYLNLSIAEIMEFQNNFYVVIVRETDTGVGAMELLVDRRIGIVGPEMGPNMMWNTKYGRQGLSRWMMGE